MSMEQLAVMVVLSTATPADVLVAHSMPPLVEQARVVLTGKPPLWRR